jgi:hypothetical protein
MNRRVLAAAALLTAVGGCTSPEATRTRAGGPGGDVGNRGDVELHGGSQPYYGTPTRGEGLLPRPDKPAAVSARPK